MKSLMENLQLVFGKSPGSTSLIGPSPICVCISVCQTRLDYLCDHVLTQMLYSLWTCMYFVMEKD